jgi:putative nucleotidyltransferase with HDIG domain
MSAARKRLLFVDDEAAILTGLENLLYRDRKHWDMVFAPGAEAALKQLRSQPFDVVISDMRMPGLDGAQLLRIVQDEFPATVRIILSGHADRESIVRALPSMHQYLSKPCDAATLRAAIDRCLAVAARPGDAAVRAIVGKLDKLPSPPHLFFELGKLAASPTSTLPQVADVVAGDPAMAAKVLQLANSAAFGLPRKTTSISQAVSYLGIELLKCIALTASVFESGNTEIAGMQEHALRVAAIAKRLVRDRKRADEAFVAALLHDIGRVILAVSGASELDVHHAEVGACLLGVWGLPPPIVDVVAHHHAPSKIDPALAEVVAAVHVADAIDDDRADTIDRAFVESIGVDLDAWSEIARQP